MKLSLAKTFKAISDNKPVGEKVFGLKSKCNFTDEKGMQISGDSIIVINPFEENAFWAWLTLCKFSKMANFDNAHLSQF